MTNRWIDKCYEIEDPDQGFQCVKQEIQKNNDSCKPRLVMLVQPGCGGCDEQKARYKNDIDNGIITLVDVATTEGAAIAKKNDISAVPALIVLDCQDNMVY